MSTIIAPPRLLETDHQEVYDWLHQQAEKLGLSVSLLTEDATIQNGWLYLPTHIDGVVDAYDNTVKLQKLEDTWNDREPQPKPPLFLVPARDPLRKALWERISHAMQRKLKAVDAFGKAVSQQEQEKAAAEFREAEQTEAEAQQAYERIMPWNERIT